MAMLTSDSFQRWAPRQLPDQGEALQPVPAVVPARPRPWLPPELGVAEPLDAHKPNAVAVQADQQVQHQQALDEGYQEGLRRGEAQATILAAQQNQQLQLALTALRNVHQSLDQQLEAELLSLSVALACQLLRRELQTDPGFLAQQIHDAVAALPGVNQGLDIHLNPADRATLMEYFQRSGEAPERYWRWLEDSSINAGGFRISSDSSRVDERLELRLSRIVRAAFADSPLLGSDDQEALGD